jgi:hypothetical protein
VRRQGFRAVRKSLPDISPSIFVENRRANLGIPKYLEALALRVVGNAGLSQGLQFGPVATQCFHEPPPPAQCSIFSKLADRAQHFD